MARSGLANRLYRGEAGLNVIGRRKLWFAVAGALILIAILSFAVRGFTLGIEFKGGNEFQVPVSVGTMQEAESAVNSAIRDVQGGADGRVVSAQQVGSADSGTYLLRTTQLEANQSTQVQQKVANEFGISAEAISQSQVSPSFGGQVTQRALLGLVVFIVLVTIYLVLRFEWRMAFAAVSSLIFDLVLTAGIYSLVGFEVTPSTVVGFLTILGWALYDVVVVFDKVQENTRGITAGSTRTYSEAANLAVNQTLMRSINTGLVALLPVGGLLFIGAGFLGAGTLKDLGLVLFVGMGIAVFSSIFFATPVLTTLKDYEPRIQAHTKRVLARRASGGSSRDVAKGGSRSAQQSAEPADAEAAALAGAAPKVGSRPAAKRSAGARGGRPGGGGNRPGGAKRR
ncbi:protein translocase subunit SecF [Micromonospora sp. NPDC049679]|uniref:protein translocase subunit SecF n=1 Tax=Micromonospora sp. NPDC049679 TaxID=3155920 RepID=UPI0033C26543